MDYAMIGPYQFDRDASKDDMRLDYCSSFQEVALDESSLSFDTVSVEVCTKTIGTQLSALPNNTPIVVYRDGEIKARFVSSGVSRIGPVTYQLTGRSPMGALTGMVHAGGIYTGQTVEEVVKEICGNIPSLIKSVYAGVKLYGWLPYADGKERSARDNLAQVLFAIGAYLRTDLNGVLRIEPLWDGTASLIDVDRSYTGGTVKYDSPISAVTVTEHQYVAGTEVKELFSGTAQNGDIITFSEPMHSLSATGFTILESGANYAKISAGTGALTGKAYIHNTRLITQPVTAGAAENVKSVTDATLVSLVNSYAVAKRLADYYRCRETITNDIVSGHEKPGHVVSVYHPYDKKMVFACIQSLDTTMSATLKSSMEALVGFTPAQPEQAEYFSERVLLTGSGTWTPPEGAEAVTAVLIGDGQDGTAGQNGEGVMLTGQTIPNTCSGSFPSASAGKGGKAGSPGSGGKIFQITMDITPGISFSYATSQNGEAVFGSHSSAEGSASPNGYYDDVTGKTYARQGAVGYDGGDGGAPGKSGRSVAGYKGGYGSQAEEYTMRMTENNIRYTQTFKHQGIGGPGAAMGTEVTWDPSRFSVGMPTFIPNIRIVGSAPGASAVSGADGENYGDGGGAGHGGGGAGGIGSCSISMSPTPPSTQHQVLNFSGDLQHGGSGSSGGKGKPGCIILFYGKKKTIKSGPLVQRGGGLFFDRLNKLFIV
jgi:hypothetical protein|uniref:Uncharacterized protein n=2 Tax=unclassified Caudoviricetes TaxID=2788787 RepID=A0A8S5VFW3_9CAUD|nr:MAG TPA: hypothetical protein [Siphoviridae sp. ctu1o13]DAG05491.1 MAG TPA: hypothetical protein [Siphoviridae sp. ct1da40]